MTSQLRTRTSHADLDRKHREKVAALVVFPPERAKPATSDPPADPPGKQRSRKPLNECTACLEDFAALAYFDAHRIGLHEYAYDPSDPTKCDGRRCLTVDELRAKGWELNERGRWTDPENGKGMRERFAAQGREAQQPTGTLAGAPPAREGREA